MERAESVRDDRRVAPRAPPNALQTGQAPVEVSRAPPRARTRLDSPVGPPGRPGSRSPLTPRRDHRHRTCPTKTHATQCEKKQQNVAPCGKSLEIKPKTLQNGISRVFFTKTGLMTKTKRSRCLFSLYVSSLFLPFSRTRNASREPHLTRRRRRRRAPISRPPPRTRPRASARASPPAPPPPHRTLRRASAEGNGRRADESAARRGGTRADA